MNWGTVMIRWIHFLSAAVWLGGLVFLAFILIPFLRKKLPPAERIRWVSAIGRRFDMIFWACILLLILSGIGNLLHEHITIQTFSNSAYGTILSIKLTGVVVVILFNLIHSYVLGAQMEKLASKIPPGSEEIPQSLHSLGQMSLFFSIFSFIVLLGITFLGILLAHG